MLHRITVLPQQQNIQAEAGANLLDVLRQAGLFANAPCGGNGRCGKCKVWIDGKEALACQTTIQQDMNITLPENHHIHILTNNTFTTQEAKSGICLAVDIGTTTVVAYLLENGHLLATESRSNPQAAYGADVVSRIQYATNGHGQQLTAAIRDCLEEMTCALLSGSNKRRIDTVCIVGNPAMQQLFLGLPIDNLTNAPFYPLLKQTHITRSSDYVPSWEGARLLTVPDIAAYVGADTVACILATGMDQSEKLTLLVDIGTNGELVMGNKDRMVACSTAAGPALEGASIHFGMRAQKGAIDHVWQENTGFGYSVIGNCSPTGICGSGLLDAVAAALDKDLLNERGKILTAERRICVSENICLTQDDIRQVQLAKGAIAAGIDLMVAHLGISLGQIEQVYLAGAFGSFLNPTSICRIGLLPQELLGKIAVCGNAAGSGAMQMACSEKTFARADEIIAAVEHLDLATDPAWAKCFAKNMRFTTTVEYWCGMAKAAGFTEAVSLDTATLKPREDVRAMCTADHCKAYGKNWTCPPHCGTLDACGARMQQYTRGILLQTVGQLEKDIDTKGYRRAEQAHTSNLHTLAALMSISFPDTLVLGSGGCRVCKTCAWPDPCRFPEKACSSMEAYGLFVTDVCRKNGLAYHHGRRTITYTACVLIS